MQMVSCPHSVQGTRVLLFANRLPGDAKSYIAGVLSIVKEWIFEYRAHLVRIVEELARTIGCFKRTNAQLTDQSQLSQYSFYNHILTGVTA